MKKFSFILTAATIVLSLQIQSFAQTKCDKSIEPYFGSIRADLFRYACEMLNVNDTALTNRIDTISMEGFKKVVKNDTVSDHLVFLPHLRQIITYSQSVDASKPFSTNYSKLYASIDSVCLSLSGNLNLQFDSIEEKRIDFHNRLALAAIEYNAYQTAIQIAESDSVFVRNQFGKLFSNGYFVRKFPGIFKKDKHEEETSKDEAEKEAKTEVMNDETATQEEAFQEDKTNNKEQEGLIRHCKQLLVKNLKYIILILLIIAIVFVYYRFVIRKKKMEKTNSGNPQTEAPTENHHQNPQNEIVEKTNITEVVTDTQQKAENRIIAPPKAGEKKDGCFMYDDNSVSIIGASVIGNSHISMNLPCQDCCNYENLGNGWGIAVTSDGAGSAEHSETGSKIVTNRAIEHFKQYLTTKGWTTRNYIPTDAEWTQVAYNIIKAVYNDMKTFAEAKSLEVKSLNATVIVVIHTPYGLLVCHVGDGRAGYRNTIGEWKSIITPHKGDEANQTIFVTSDFWGIPNYVMSGVMVPECRVIRDKVTAFTLMSDGCESTSWLYNQQNENGRFYDPNLPFAKFFNPLTESLKKMHDDNVSTDERLEGWRELLKTGGKFAKEPDDKTMILGLILQ